MTQYFTRYLLPAIAITYAMVTSCSSPSYENEQSGNPIHNSDTAHHSIENPKPSDTPHYSIENPKPNDTSKLRPLMNPSIRTVPGSFKKYATDGEKQKALEEITNGVAARNK